MTADFIHGVPALYSRSPAIILTSQSYWPTAEITAQEAFKHPQKNIILRAVGAEDELEVDCFTLELTADTKLLLCSDGLSDMVDDRQISEILQAHQTAEAAEVLLEAALDNGGRDNISLILIDLTPTEEDNRS